MNFVSLHGTQANIISEIKSHRKTFFLLGGKISKIYKFELGESGRSFIMIDKKSGSPKKYPRKAGTPSRNPL